MSQVNAVLPILQVRVSDVVHMRSAEAVHEILAHIPGVLGVTMDGPCEADPVRTLPLLGVPGISPKHTGKELISRLVQALLLLIRN